MVKVDFHVHTKYSPDSNISLEVLKKVCDKRKILPAITDHNTIKGALKFKNCIKGEEIKTTEGEIIGLFLNEEIKKGLSIEETVDKIREQDGIVYIPHPFDIFRIRSTIKRLNFPIDIIEVFNSRLILNYFNVKAYKFAKKNNLLKGVGSDAHLSLEVGRSYAEMQSFKSKKELLKNLKKAKLMTQPSPIYVHALSKFVQIRK